LLGKTNVAKSGGRHAAAEPQDGPLSRSGARTAIC
jgi:hypothetical protein